MEAKKVKGKGKGNAKRGDRGGTKSKREQDQWKYVPPKDGEPHTKVGPTGRTYHWCPNHLMWTIHTPAQCNKVPSSDDQPSSNSSDSKSNEAEGGTDPVGFSTSLTLDDILASIGEEEKDE